MDPIFQDLFFLIHSINLLHLHDTRVQFITIAYIIHCWNYKIILRNFGILDVRNMYFVVYCDEIKSKRNRENNVKKIVKLLNEFFSKKKTYLNKDLRYNRF